MTKDEIMNALRVALKKDGRVASVFADALKMNAVSIRRFRSGSRDISIGNAEKLAIILGRQIEWELVKKLG